jgi:hypothetical protein
LSGLFLLGTQKPHVLIGKPTPKSGFFTASRDTQLRRRHRQDRPKSAGPVRAGFDLRSGRISFFRETLRNGALDYRIESGTALLRVPGRADQSRRISGKGQRIRTGGSFTVFLSPPKVLCWKWRENAAQWLSRQSATDRRPPQLAASSFGSIICKIPSCLSSIVRSFFSPSRSTEA